MIKAYKYRLLPTEEQKATLNQWMGMCRFVYNLALESKIAAWKSLAVNVTGYDLMKQLTELKNTECPWLKDCSTQSLYSSIANIESAFKGFYRGGGYPKFKKRKNSASIHFRQFVRVKGGKVFLTKLGGIDFIEHRKVGEGKIINIVVSKNSSGEYYVSIVIKNTDLIPDKKEVLEKTSVGIDVGLKTFATLSDGQIFDNPKYLATQQQRLKKEQRTLSKRYKNGVKAIDQSKSYHKQRLVVAKLHQKIANQRNDFLHKTSTAIIKQFDTICLEDLKVSNLVKNHSLAKAISDVGWGEFSRQLKYKADWYGKNIVFAGRFYPSSKMCSNCGDINNELQLSDRDWTCNKCNVTHDRDLNASINIKNFGFKAEPSTANVGH